MLRKLLIFFLFAFGVSFITAAIIVGFSQEETIKKQPIKPVQDHVQRMYFLINEYKKEKGLNILNVHSLLEKSARAKIDDMVKYDYWSHNNREGLPPWRFFAEVGYKYSLAGENMMRGSFTPEEVLKYWKQSKKHNENLINANFEEMGYSRVCGVTLTKIEDTCVMSLHLGKRL